MRSTLYPVSLIPTFWRYSKSDERYVLDAAEQSVADLQRDITTRYNALEIETCDDFKPELMRPMYLYRLTDQDIWPKLKEYQKNFFKSNYYIWPEGDVWMCNQEITDAETLYNGTYLVRDTDYFVRSVSGSGGDTDSSVGSGVVQFTNNPFDVFSGQTSFQEVTTPWRKTYECEVLVLWASKLKMTESVLDTHYADLIMDKDVQQTFRNSTSYQSFVYNFYKVLYQGATTAGLVGFINSMSGLEYIQEDYETISTFYFDINPDTNCLCRVIVTDKHKYYLPVDITVGPWVKLGARLPKFTALGEYLTVRTYLEDPDWIFSYGDGVLNNVVVMADGSPLDKEYPYTFKNESVPLPEACELEGDTPRFDICKQVSVNEIQSLSTGLWHNVVGPNLVVIEYPQSLVNTAIKDALENIILPEITPIHVFCHWERKPIRGWFYYDPEEEAWFQDELGNLIEDLEGPGDTPAPVPTSLDVTSPEPGETYLPGETILIAGNAQPDTMPVSVYVNDELYAELDGGDFSTEYLVPAPGAYRVMIKFADKEADIDTECETFSVTLSAPDVVFTGDTIHVSGITDLPSGATVNLAVSGIPSTTSVVSGGTFEANILAGTQGVKIITASAEYADSVTATVNVRNHTINITSLEDGQSFFTGDMVIISGETDLYDGTEISIAFGEETLTATANNGEFSCEAVIESAGNIEITASAENSDPDFVWITASDHTIEITSPEPDQQFFVGDTITVNGTTDYEDGTILDIAIHDVVSLSSNGNYTTAEVNNGTWSAKISAEDFGDFIITAYRGSIVAEVQISITIRLQVITPETGTVIANRATIEATVVSPSSVSVYLKDPDNTETYVGSIVKSGTGTEPFSGIITLPDRSGQLVGTVVKIVDDQEVLVDDLIARNLVFKTTSQTAVVPMQIRLPVNRTWMVTERSDVSLWHPDIQYTSTVQFKETGSTDIWIPEHNNAPGSVGFSSVGEVTVTILNNGD